MIACGLSCQTPESPQQLFEQVRRQFIHGDLVNSQAEAERAYKKFSSSEPDWAWRFRLLQAEILLWRGMYPQALDLLQSPPAKAELGPHEQIIRLAIQGTAQARTHHFAEADQVLAEAEQLCNRTPDSACGEVIRARGIQAVQRGALSRATGFFVQDLNFARSQSNQFLEAASLLNLGLVALEKQHFDEAIDWTEAASKVSSDIDAEVIATKAMGNLGWAYYNLGDADRSLQLSQEAEKRAHQVGDVIDELSWLTNAGYVYAQAGDLSGAKQAYMKALDLARQINGRKDVYNALRALALVCLQNGELDQSRKFADEAFEIAHADGNRSNELYPLLAKGMLAAQSRDAASAKQILSEVEHDPNGNAALTWRAEHSLARLYEEQGETQAADREYRLALATFETARASLKRNDSRLPFSSNAAQIYDDYICFLSDHARHEEAMRWADYGRSQTLKEGLKLLSTKVSTTVPSVDPRSVARRLNATILFYWLGRERSFLWAINSEKLASFQLPPATNLDSAVKRFRQQLTGTTDVLSAASGDGEFLYRTLVAPAQEMVRKHATAYIIPDGSLNSLNFETLPVSQPTAHYWIEDVTITNAASLRMLDTWKDQRQNNDSNLLMFGNTVSAGTGFPDLPASETEMNDISKHFGPAQQQVFSRDKAIPAAYLASAPEKFAYIHFVAHGTASSLSPLDSAIVLSRESTQASPPQDDSFKLYARDIIQHPLRAKLVTISACYSAGTRAYSGEGLVGLSWAFLRAGAHNVVAALWDVSDVSTPQLMDRFYEELKRGNDPAASLRSAKLSLLHSNTAFRKPFYWAAFQLYSGS